MKAPLFKALFVACIALVPQMGSLKAQTLSAYDTASNRLHIRISNAASGSVVKLSGLADADFGTKYSSDTSQIFVNSGPICFYHTSPTFSLTVSRISNPEKPAGLMVVSQAGDTIPINMLASTNRTYTASTLIVINPFMDGVALTGLVGNKVSENCTSGDVGYLTWKIRDGSSTLAPSTPAGDYTATFQYTMAAE